MHISIMATPGCSFVQRIDFPFTFNVFVTDSVPFCAFFFYIFILHRAGWCSGNAL